MGDLEARAKRYFTAWVEGDWEAVAEDWAKEDESVRECVSQLLEARGQLGAFMEHPVLAGFADEEVPLGTLVGERYRVESLLGSGSFAVVYRARDERMAGMEVALKVFRTSLVTPAMLSLEVQALARLNHVAIAGALNVGETAGGRPFLVRRYVAGRTLREVLSSRRLSADEAVSMLRQIGEALASAHAVGLVHCDLKPENVLVGGGTDRITLIDFGLQDFMDTGQRRVLYSRGEHVAPELLAGEPARPAADVYAMGGMAAEMLPGRHRRLVAAMRSKEPEDRPQLAEVLKALEPRRRLWWWVGAAAVIVAGGMYWASALGVTEVDFPVPWTSFPGTEDYPTLTPTGDQVVFSWKAPGSLHTKLFRMPVGAAEATALTQGPHRDHYASMAPNGQEIAYLRELPGGRNELRTIRIDGTGERFLLSGHFNSLCWLADGTGLLVARGVTGEGPWRLAEIPVARPDAGRMLTPDDGVNRTYPTVSPNGSWVAYVQWAKRGNDSLVVAERVGTAEMLVERRRSPIYPGIKPPQWSPDGRHLLFATGRANNRMVHVAPYEDLRRPEVLPAFGQRLDGLAVARERTVAVVNQAQSDHNVWAISLPGPGARATGMQKLMSTTWDDEEPAIAEAAGSVLFVSDQSGDEQIWKMGWNGESPGRLTDFKDASGLAVFGLADRQAVVVTGTFGGEPGYFEMAMSGGTGPVTGRGTAIGVARDGKSVFVSRKADKREQIWRVGLGEDRGEVLVLSEPATRMEESTDGEWLWFCFRVPGPVWRMPRGGGKREAMTGPVERRAFVVGSEGLYFVEQPAPKELRYRRFGEEKYTVIAELQGRISYGMSLDRRERRLVLAQEDAFGADLLRVNRFRLR